MNRWMLTALAALVAGLATLGMFMFVPSPPQQAPPEVAQVHPGGEETATTNATLTPAQSAPLWLARADVSAQRYDEAVVSYRSAIELIPEPQRQARLHVELANLYLVSEAPDLALASFRAAADLDPQNMHAKLGLGRTLIMRSAFDDAAPILTALANDESSDDGQRVEAWTLLVELETGRNDGRAAIRAADAAVALAATAETREAACLTRLRFRRPAGGQNVCIAQDPLTARGLIVEGMYWLTLSNAIPGRGPAYRSASDAFQSAANLAEGDPTWRARAVYGATLVGACAGERRYGPDRASQDVQDFFGRYVPCTAMGEAIANSPLPTGGDTSFLRTLIAQDRAPLTRADFEAVAARLGARWEAVAAVAEVESGPLGGFAADGRPVILFERHVFSRRTNSRYDRTHPHISNREPGGYPRTQAERWAQLEEAYALDAEAALQSAAYGRFQVYGQNYANLNMANAHEYVSKLARSERDQLEVFEGFVRANNLADELARLDWAGFASRYNGPGYAQFQYDTKMAEAYARLVANPIN